MKGLFISFEGPDGAGKTSVLAELVPRLEARAKTAVEATREPGGSKIAEKIRQIILDPANTAMDPRTEALLYAAARRQHLVEKVQPALRDGKILISDRFVDSSIAYQGAGRAIGMEEIAQINRFATEGLTPDLTIFLAIDPLEGLRRIKQHRFKEDQDRLDLELPAFHERVAKGYEFLCRKYPERIRPIDASRPLAAVVSACEEVITQKFPQYFYEGGERGAK